MNSKTLIGAAVVGILSASLSAGAAGKVKCEGGNACKGQGGCANKAGMKKNASAECKGHGFVMTKDQAACDAAKAKNEAPAAKGT